VSSSGPSLVPHSRASFTRADEAAVVACLRGGMVAQGARVRAFEAELVAHIQAADATETRTATVVSSGTAALVLALQALGVERGDEVVMPTYVCRAVFEAVRCVGATPILADNVEHRCIALSSVKPLLTKRTKAIIAVDTLGHPAAIEALLSTGVPVIEDACQGVGDPKRPLGFRGTLGVISFQGTKLIPIGEGGAVLCSDAQLASRLAGLRDGAEGARFGAQLSDLSAALGSSVLARIDRVKEQRWAIAERYRAALAQQQAVSLPATENVPYRFPLRLHGAKSGDFQRVAAEFLKRGVVVRRGVDAMCHRLFPHAYGSSESASSEHAYQNEGGSALLSTVYPVAECDFSETVSIPLYESMSETEIAQVERALREVFR
jgi:perosamine synthetase